MEESEAESMIWQLSKNALAYLGEVCKEPST